MLIGSTAAPRAHLSAVEDPKELNQLEASVIDLIQSAVEAAKRLESLADSLGLYEPVQTVGAKEAEAPAVPGIVPRLHDSTRAARREIARIHQVCDRLNRLA